MHWREKESGQTSLLGQIVTLAVKLVLGVAGFIFMLSLLLAGLIALVLLMLWSLLHGRRPVLGMPRFSMPPGRQWGFPKTAARRSPVQQDAGEVVDIQAREIPDVSGQAPPPVDPPR